MDPCFIIDGLIPLIFNNKSLMKFLGILSGFKNLRMRTQIIIVNTAFLALVRLVVACCIYVETTIFNMIASDSS